MALTRVLIVDDHALMREGVRRLLPIDAYTVVGEAASAREALRILDAHEQVIDVAVVDYGLPDLNGVECAEQMLALRPQLSIMLLSAYDDEEIVYAAIHAKIRAFVKKTEPTAILLEALRVISTGGAYLSSTASDRVIQRVLRTGAEQRTLNSDPAHIKEISPRELQVLRLIAQGKQTKEIAADLNLSDQTVKTHRKSVMKRLGAHNQAQLITIAARHRLIYLSNQVQEWRD